MKSLLAILALGIATLLSAQSQQAWTCPSPRAQAACDSFREETKGKGTLSFGEYVCFRENARDQYFNIFTGESILQWSGHDTNGRPKPTATAFGIILGWVTNHGVKDENMPPGFLVDGVWQSPSSPRFVQRSDGREGFLKVSVTNSEIKVDETFTNLDKTKTKYHLNLDRNTNRFLERWDSPDNLQESYGRCIAGEGSTK